MNLVARYLLGVMIAVNQLGNAVTGGNPQESISSRLGDARARGSKAARATCWALEQVDFHPRGRADHCDGAMTKHQRRLQDNLNKASTPRSSPSPGTSVSGTVDMSKPSNDSSESQ